MQFRASSISKEVGVPAILIALLSFGLLSGNAQGQVIETETARLLRQGGWKFGANFEYQTSSDGSESAIPFLVEYGIRDDLELTLEPTPYVRIAPKSSSGATGFGDTELTLTYLFSKETDNLPAFAVATEVKFPTTKNDLIGTGETDYTAYLIASKRFGDFDVHAHLSYTISGDPSGVNLDNVYGFGLASVYRINPEWEVFGEVLGNTSAMGGEGGSGESSLTPEASTSELSGTIGVGRFFDNGLLIHAAISEDTNSATQLRIGFVYSF